MKQTKSISKSLVLSFVTAILFVASGMLPQNAEARSKKTSSTNTMSCFVSVQRAVEAVPENEQNKLPVEKRNVRLLEIPLDADGEADQEFVINGETVVVLLSKYQYADLYKLTLLLTTPTSELPPKGPSFHAAISDNLVNSGPFRDDGFSPIPNLGKPTTRFEFLDNQSGSIALTRKMIAALKAEGRWGQYPFTSGTLDINSGMQVAEFAEQQVAAGKLLFSDIIAISTIFTCTLSK